MKRRYIYHVKAKIGRNSWVTQFFISCSNMDEILPLMLAAGYDNTNAYGEPKEQVININAIQKIAACASSEENKQPYIIELYRLTCDINPHDDTML